MSIQFQLSCHSIPVSVCLSCVCVAARFCQNISIALLHRQLAQRRNRPPGSTPCSKGNPRKCLCSILLSHFQTVCVFVWMYWLASLREVLYALYWNSMWTTKTHKTNKYSFFVCASRNVKLNIYKYSKQINEEQTKSTGDPHLQYISRHVFSTKKKGQHP